MVLRQWAVVVGLLPVLVGGVAPSRVWGQLESTQADRRPVKTVADQHFPVTTPQGNGIARLVVSADWSKPLPAVKRAILVIHGSQRSIDANRRAVLKARQATGIPAGEVLLILPQFLIQGDVASWRLPEDTLNWPDGSWSAGGPALSPAPLSTFDVMDAILAQLADRERFP
ncbi:MAG TPA: alpha/beta hydrolase, partial [bacterium]